MLHNHKDALRGPWMKAYFKSPRVAFQFNTNHYPIPGLLPLEFGQTAQTESFETEIWRKCVTNYIDSYVKDAL